MLNLHSLEEHICFQLRRITHTPFENVSIEMMGFTQLFLFREQLNKVFTFELPRQLNLSSWTYAFIIRG